MPPEAAAPTPLFTPSAQVRAAAQLTAFLSLVYARTGADFRAETSAAPFHRWSVENDRLFWALFLEFSGLPYEGAAEPVLEGDGVETARFFPELRLNYAEALLSRSAGRDAAPALLSIDELGLRSRLYRGDLRQMVKSLAVALRARGIGPTDRVVGLVRNTAESAVAALAVTALGATWSSVSPDLGDDAIASRFVQLEPIWLFAHGHTRYHGVKRDLSARLRSLCGALRTLRGVVALDEGVPEDLGPPVESIGALIEAGAAGAVTFEFPRLPFDHPLFILFSSGTTGPPKGIVHGVGGTLLEHAKEHQLHCDFRPGDRVFFHTTCGWMMWNWLLSALACGAEVVLYDGSVSHPRADTLWELVAHERVTVFGTGPTYLGYCKDAGLEPGRDHDLSALRAIQSTGSVLFPAQYDWIFEHVKPLPIHSISGGTDILGCFVLGHPTAPLYRGESMACSLGLDVREVDGELVCGRPFPSRPVAFVGDEDGARRHAAYFAQRTGFWTHGDFVELTERGTARILGRSDGVLNLRGVRVGPGEIYQVVQEFPEVLASMAVTQPWPAEPGGTRLVLFVELVAGVTLDRPLTLRLKKALSARASAVHVPAVIAQVDALPTTHSGKRSERAAQDALDGRPVRNLGALRNPECLDGLTSHPALQV